MCNKKVMGAHTVLDVQILSCEFIGCDHFICTFIVSVGLSYAYISVLYLFRVNKMKTKFMCFFIKTTTLKGLSHEIDFKNVDKNLHNFS